MPHTASRPTQPLSNTYMMVRAVGMETSQATRQIIVTLYREGYSVCAIARRCGVHRNTVHRWLRRQEQSGATNNLPRPGRPRCTTPNQDQVNNYILIGAQCLSNGNKFSYYITTVGNKCLLVIRYYLHIQLCHTTAFFPHSYIMFISFTRP